MIPLHMWRYIFFGVLLGLILFQLLDVLVHVATNQVEVLRILGSVTVIVWALALAAQTCLQVVHWKLSSRTPKAFFCVLIRKRV